MAENTKIKSFTDLDAWREAHKLVLKIYEKTKEFPKEEMLCLVNQMRRCAISITSNIAEGFSRNSSKEKIQFYYISLGLSTELQSQLLICRDLKYIKNEDFNVVAEQTVKVCKIINGLIRKLREK